jgi:hypothetical protein
MGRAVEEVSLLMAEGNLLVFKELVPFFQALVAGSSPEPIAGLHAAADAYVAASRASEDPARSLLVLRGNVLAVAHEQRRLQRYISGALNAPIDRGVRRVIDQEIARWMPGPVARMWAWVAVGAICKEADGVWDDAATDTMMKLVTSDEHLDLHDTLPPPPGSPLFAPPLDGRDAAAALRPWDRTGGTGSPCGVQDWSHLGQRMCYIVNLFRSRQRSPALAAPPFTPDQLSTMEQRHMPAGPL